MVMTAEMDAPQLILEVGAQDDDVEYRDRLARDLLREIQEVGLEAKPKPAETAPEGPGTPKVVDPMAIATLIMPLLVAVAPKLVDVLKDWATRGEGRTLKITVKDKKGNVSLDIEYDPKRTSPDELQKLIKLAQKS
jgi:hypothetical protein